MQHDNKGPIYRMQLRQREQSFTRPFQPIQVEGTRGPLFNIIHGFKNRRAICQ